MRYIIVFALFLSQNSKAQNIACKYEKKGEDYMYKLELNADSSFSFSKNYFEVRSNCIGKWTVSQDTILLKCNPAEKIEETLQRGYMTERESILIILPNRDLKYKQIILNRRE